MFRINLKGRFTPAAVTAAAALAVAGTGSAVAGSLIDSDDIRNNSVRSADVRDRSIAGKDVKKRTLGVSHLTDSARAALKGQIGPRGPMGFQGPKGDKGETGAAGKDGTAKAYGTMAADGTLTRAFGVVKAEEVQGFTATYCIDTAVPVDNAVATMTGGQAPIFVTVDYGRGAGDVCPEGTDVTIRTSNTAGQLTHGGFSFLAN